MRENKYSKIITFLLYIIYIGSLVFFVIQKELGNVGIIVLSMLATFILRIINKKSKRFISDNLYIIIVLFTMIASLLGSCYNFYAKINHYDDFLHLWSGFISCSVAFSLLVFFNGSKQVSNMSKIFIIIFLFMFSMGVASIWEIAEFSIDNIMGMNTQAGGLEDTIIDMIDALVGTLIMIPFTMKKISNI